MKMKAYFGMITLMSLVVVSTTLGEVVYSTGISGSTISANPGNKIVNNWWSQKQDLRNKGNEWFKKIPKPSRLPSFPSQPRPVPLPRIWPDPKPEPLPTFPPYPQPVPLTIY